jgi:SAM-dependent methyltransferase
MERLFHQREWQNVQFRELGVLDWSSVAGREFYSTFYQFLIARADGPTPKWIEHKRKIGRLLAEGTAWEGYPGKRLRAFSVGAGLGIVEDELCSHGFSCDAMECETRSLSWLKKNYPRIQVLVGDGLNLPCRSEVYDLVFMSAVDYCFDRTQYAQVLGEMRRLAKPEGHVVCVCVSNLSLKSLARGAVKSVLMNVWGSPHHADGDVAWGYQRTVGEHINAGLKAGLECERVYLLNQDFEVVSIRQPNAVHLGWPTIRDHVVVLDFKRAAA